MASLRATEPSLTDAARHAARRAADASGVEVALLDDMASLDAGATVLADIWRSEERPVSAELLRALSHAGGYVAGARLGRRLVAVSVGLLGWDDTGIVLHSHISGVLPDCQGRHIGFALKQHQRAWALDHGLDRVTWTYDPLVRRNGYFNLVKLGATVVDFRSDFYGVMHDAINQGDPTDRAIVEWQVAAPSAVEAASGRRSGPIDAAGDVILRADDNGQPVSASATGAMAEALLAWVPDDVVALRHSDPDRARAWRLALRDTFGQAVGDGYRATAMTRDGWYVLRRAT